MDDFGSDVTAATASTRCIYVLSDVDGYKYKLVLQGEVQQLTVGRIKKYLHKSAGIEPRQQLLSFNGVALRDSMNGEEAGLFNGAILRLQQVAPNTHETDSGSYHSHHGYIHLHDRPLHTVSPQHGYAFIADNTRPVPSTARTAATFAVSAPTPPPPLVSSPSHQQEGFRDARGCTAGPSAHPCFHRSSSAPSRTAASSLPLASIVEQAHTAQVDQKSANSGPSFHRVQPEHIGEAEHCAFQNVQTHHRDTEARVAALAIENVRLREQLQVVARQAADAQSDWRQEEEIAQLKAALAAARKNKADAELAAAQRWRVKEEELVKELDLLREERRRLQEDASGQETKLQDLLHSMEGEIRSLQYELHDKDAALQSARLDLAGLQAQLHASDNNNIHQRSGQLAQRREIEPLHESLDVLAEQALSHLSYFLALPAPLQLDAVNNTCVIPVSPTLNLLMTLDRETEHLYLYVTLLNELPSSPVKRMRLYEMLLQGALLGKDMAGGSVGLSTESNLILMSTSADLRHNGALALAAAAPSFVESAILWEEKINELLQE